jgi:hypothetical protein
MRAIAKAEPGVLAPLLRGSEGKPVEPYNEQFPATIACPSCHAELVKNVRITAESSRRASTRPATPERIATGPGCHDLAILSLHPASDPKEAGR